MDLQSFSIKFFPLASRVKTNDFPIYCRITIDRKKAEFYTGQNTSITKWDDSKGRVKGNPDKSGILSLIEENIRKYYTQKVMKGEHVSAKECRDHIKGNNDNATGLLQYVSKYINDLLLLPDEYSTSTIKLYRSLRVHLQNYLNSKGQKEILLIEFNLKKVNEFEFFLRTQAKLNINSSTKYLKQLKSVYNRAIQFGIAKENPLKDFKFKHEKVNRSYLTKEEIHSLEKLDSLNKSLEIVRDCFLLSVYTGLRYSDINELTTKNIRLDREKNTWIDLNMVKTNDVLNIPVLDKANDIFKKYKIHAEQTGKLIPVLSNQKLNSYLKILADFSGINKKITFHVARHTFATTITLSNNIPIEVVSKLLGHSSLETTQIYAKITNNYLLETNSKLNKILQ